MHARNKKSILSKIARKQAELDKNANMDDDDNNTFEIFNKQQFDLDIIDI